MQNNIVLANPTLEPEQLGTDHSLRITGKFEVEIIRNGETIHHEFFNGTTNEGLNNMLGVTFHGDTQQSAWYLFLIGNTGYSTLAAGDTMASHTSNWNETVAYSETTRQQWTCGAAASKSITNATAVTFTISVDNTVVKGIGICSDNTKSGTTGKLWSTGLFTADQTLLSGDQLKITYVVNVS